MGTIGGLIVLVGLDAAELAVDDDEVAGVALGAADLVRVRVRVRAGVRAGSRARVRVSHDLGYVISSNHDLGYVISSNSPNPHSGP